MTHLRPQIKPEELHIGCATCSSASLQADMDMRICVGFGYAALLKDDKEVWNERDNESGEWEGFMTVQQAEDMAAADPDHDWQIVLHGPLHGETYQRHGAGQWLCIESNQGFA